MPQHDAEHYVLHYHRCRNVSSPEDEAEERSVYAGCCPASELVNLPDDDNIRSDLVEAKGKTSQVHLAIQDSFENTPEIFGVLNGGVTIVARDAYVDDRNKYARLTKAGLINGSQTQGVIKRVLEKNPETDPSVQFQLMVVTDESLIHNISVARNYQNPVPNFSISAHLGKLDSLQEAVAAAIPGIKLRMKESDVGPEFTDTEKLIQVTLAALPPEVFAKVLPGKKRTTAGAGKSLAYSAKTRCLSIYEDIQENNPEAHQCFLDVAPIAWKLYLKWIAHQGFRGSGVRAIRREGSRIDNVPDGIVFPIIAAHGALMKKDRTGKWVMRHKEPLDQTLIDTALETYMDPQMGANHKPHLMGRGGMCYNHLYMAARMFAV